MSEEVIGHGKRLGLEYGFWSFHHYYMALWLGLCIIGSDISYRTWGLAQVGLLLLFFYLVNNDSHDFPFFGNTITFHLQML